MYRSLFSRDLFAEMDRLQRELQQAFDFSPSIRGFARGGFPALNVGRTTSSYEVYAFAPGIDPASIEISLDRGVLTLRGERKPPAGPAGATAATPPAGAPVAMHIAERFSGPFRRVVSLPDDVDPDRVNADYRDGVLHVSARRREAALPRRIAVQ